MLDDDDMEDAAYAIGIEEAATLPLAELRKRVSRVVADVIRLAKPGELPDDFPFEPDALTRDALLAPLAKHEYWFAPILITDWYFKVRPGEISDPQEALVAKNRLN